MGFRQQLPVLVKEREEHIEQWSWELVLNRAPQDTGEVTAMILSVICDLGYTVSTACLHGSLPST